MPRKQRSPPSRSVLWTMAALDQDIAGLQEKKPGAVTRARRFLLHLATDAELLLYVFKAMAKWLGGKNV